MLFFRVDRGEEDPRSGLTEASGLSRLFKPGVDLLSLLQEAESQSANLGTVVDANLSDEVVELDALIAEGKVLSPVPSAPSSLTLVTGTGLTHKRSAEIRDEMNAESDANGSDSMKMYVMGEKAGRVVDETPGVQPEWFFKGTQSCLVPSGHPITIPSYALSAGEEVEVAGVYLIGPDGSPIRLGFVLVNDFSDHQLEQQNYLYLAPSKLRQCAIGPHLWVGDLPDDVVGEIAIRRSSETVWRREFRSGNANMTHSIENLEHHHFKHSSIIAPGDIHIHLFGCPVFSFGDGISLQDGDELEMSSPSLGGALRNPVTNCADRQRLVRVETVGP